MVDFKDSVYFPKTALGSLFTFLGNLIFCHFGFFRDAGTAKTEYG